MYEYTLIHINRLEANASSDPTYEYVNHTGGTYPRIEVCIELCCVN